MDWDGSGARRLHNVTETSASQMLQRCSPNGQGHVLAM